MNYLFWIAMAGIIYAYVGYPLLLAVLPGRRVSSAAETQLSWPSVTVVLPVHNEEQIIGRKVENLLTLAYPEERLEIVVVSDASTDGTDEIIRLLADSSARLRAFRVPGRTGKAAALNMGLEKANGDIVVFTDASIMLEPKSVSNLIRAFEDPMIGCASGEDRIEGESGEGLYGRYELFLRRKESEVHSIVGASGCFYAQRREICRPFIAGVAPDFQSVLDTVRQGFRAISIGDAVGVMGASGRSNEFQRKIRTVLRGMTTLGSNLLLLNPLRFGLFSFSLISHKLVRWLVPICLCAVLFSSVILRDVPFYRSALTAQIIFYSLGVMSLWRVGQRVLGSPGRIAEYFLVANAAILAASVKWVLGIRQELWTPTRRKE
jgi:glycosyltransferase involved in cell wall biosynthesis